MILSYCFMLLTIEPTFPAPPREPMRTFLSGILPLLRRDQSFRRYLFCRAAIALGLIGHSFLTAAAIERFNPSEAEIGVFTAALLASQAVCNLGLGALADRWGHKQVLELSTGVGMLALLLAFLAPSVGWFLAIFILVGAAQAGYQLSGFTLVLRFSSLTERPAYIGVANTMLAPVAIAGPLLAGLLADLTSYNLLFITLMFVGLGGLVALHWRVSAPQPAGRPAASSD
jgi:MFS family permease